MEILHLALGGCLKAPPINFGITADSGGHLAYVLDAAIAQARCPEVSRVRIVTRQFGEDYLPSEHGLAFERISDRVSVERIATTSSLYLEKEDLAAELPSFTRNFIAYLEKLPELPDVVHAHFADAAEVALAVRQHLGIPFVYTPHALAIDKLAQGIVCAGLEARISAERQAIATADALIVSTRDEAERQVHRYGVPVDGRIFCIAPGVPQRPDTAGARTLVDGLSDAFDRPDLPIILAIARPVAKKNLSALVKAYAGDPLLQASANLVILAGQDDGRSSDEELHVRDELRRLCDTPALRRRVFLPARHDAADVSALYRRAAQGGVFVNPALHEPFGLTLIEAAEAGVPVVATCYGGPTEIIATIGHGLLVEPRDDAAIAQACRAIIGDAQLHARLRAAALSNHGCYDWAQFAAASMTTYRGVLPTPKLLVCDIDYTLTGCAAGAAAFSRWRQQSALPFIVATGRSLDEARIVLGRWNLPEPDAFITDVGTRITRTGSDGIWQSCEAWAAALDEGWDRAAIIAALAPLALTLQAPETAGPHKVSFFGTADDAARIRARLAVVGLAAKVIFSHGRLIDVLAARGGKAAAVAAYAASIGLGLSHCVAAGDSGNDEDMLEQCGSAIIVGNANEELAGLATRTGLYRAQHHHAAGVMEGLEWFGLADADLKVAA